MFILQTELPHYFEFKTNIGKYGEINFSIDNKKLEYKSIPNFIKYEYKLGEKRKKETEEQIEINQKKLDKLKEEIAIQEIEYLAKEKQISTFLECKKSFFGKFKYYFKYSKKKNPRINNEENKSNIEDEKIEEKTIHKKKNEKQEIKDKYTLEELIEEYKELEEIENLLKNKVLDINSLKLKKKNMARKIENASVFIEEIDSHKKSIFEFWKYSNKDEMAALPEGEEEEVNIIRKITKVFDYEQDLEKFGKNMDKLQRKVLSKQETDSIYITSTNVLEILNLVKNNEVSPKEISLSLKELRKEAIEEKMLTQSDEFDIFGGAMQDKSKVSKIKNKTHREIPKDKFNILEINKNTKPIGYKLSLEKVIDDVKHALKKVNIEEDLPVYKALSNLELDKKEINIFNINPEKEIKNVIEKDKENYDVSEEINFYKLNLKQNDKAISFTNCIFYDNQNKTLPLGQDLSTNILVDTSKIENEFVNTNTFQIVDFEDESDFSEIVIRKIKVFEE